MADYSSIINDAAKQYNIDPKLLSAVINVESSGNPNAKGSPTKYGTAQGIAQLLPQTAASLGVKNPNDPAQAIPAMAKLLDENLTRYGNVADALHAYHGGTDQSNWGPKTQAYAQKVLGQIGAGQNTNLPGVPSSQNSDADAEAYFKQFTGKASPQASQEDAFFNSFAVGGKPATKSTAAPNPSQQVPSGVLGSIQSAGAGAGKAFGEGMLGLQSLVGKGLQQVSSQGPIANAAQWLINDAAKGRAKLEAENAPYQAAAPVSNVVGQIGGVLAPGAAIAKGIGAGVNLGARAANIEAAAAPLVRAISTGGASSGNATELAGLATRAAGGGITGAGLGAVYNPESIGTSAGIGAAVPVVGAGLGAIGRTLSNVAGGNVTPEVGALAQRAKSYGIDIRPDQILNSKPVNAVSSVLDYLPFSGKGSATNAQNQQFKTALSNTIGENTPNLARALNSAETRLGGEFDKVLKGTTVNADNGLMNDLSGMLNNARNEMTDQQFSVINRQVDNLLNKVQPGDIIAADAAYNIKKGLDRLGKSNDSTLAYYARDMRNSLMDAMSRSMPDQGASFAQTRKQWANLMELQKLVPAGAEGDISAARLANARNVKTPELSDLRDIAAQFLKPRVGDSGTAQRLATLGSIPSAATNPGLTASVLAGGRLANTVLGNQALGQFLANRAVTQGLQGAAGGLTPASQIAPVLQRLLQPGALGSLSELSRQPVAAPVPAR